MHSYEFGGGFSALGSSARSASSLARALRAEEYSLRNRIRSIIDDRAFVQQTRAEYPTLTLYANLSCGLWYVPCVEGAATSASAVDATTSTDAMQRQHLARTCYFKSTDGHVHHWKFSAARLNVQVVQRIVEQQQQEEAAGAQAATDEAGVERVSPSASSPTPRCVGALIVDSTRKGKRLPDSFSRTLPIWCTVWNRALLRVRQRMDAAAADLDTHTATVAEWDTDLHMPLSVSDMEKAQIEERLDGFVQTLLDSGVELEPLARGLRKPLRCLWLDRSSGGWQRGEEDLRALPFTPLVLLQCSRVEADTRGVGQRQGWSYIQGAGDDEENWLGRALQGFTPAHLTRHATELLQCDYDEEIIERVRDILHDEAVQRATAKSAEAEAEHSSLILHRIPFQQRHLLACTTLPSYAAAQTSAQANELPLALLYLYFDSSHASKMQVKSKLARQQQRAEQRAQGEDEEADSDESESDEQSVTEGPPSLETQGWTTDSAVAMPISSLSKSRHSLLDILSPSVAFAQAQWARGRTLIVACEDAVLLASPTSSSAPSSETGSESVPAASTSAAAAASLPTEAGAATASAATPPTPTPVPAGVASCTSPPLSARSSAAVPVRVDKHAIRSALSVLQCHLPQHFPSRLLVKQLNTFFMSHGH